MSFFTKLNSVINEKGAAYVVLIDPDRKNEDLEDSPDKVNADPYGDGWLIKVTPSNVDEKNELMNFLSYEELIG